MFCDLVGSTALSARLDPEDMRRVIRVYQDASRASSPFITALWPSSWATAFSPTLPFPVRMRTTRAGSPRRSGFVLPHRALGSEGI